MGLDNLIDLVSAATGPSPEIDRAVRRHFNPAEAVNNSYSSSIDAVVALADREMPSAYWHVSGYVTADGKGLFYATFQPAGATSYSVGGLPNEARARLLAFLRAVKAKQQDGTDA